MEAVASLAQILQVAEVSFKIITPYVNFHQKILETLSISLLLDRYDAQRNLLEKILKDNGLGWENKCFNVDSFQGMIPSPLFLLSLSITDVAYSTPRKRG